MVTKLILSDRCVKHGCNPPHLQHLLDCFKKKKNAKQILIQKKNYPSNKFYSNLRRKLQPNSQPITKENSSPYCLIPEMERIASMPYHCLGIKNLKKLTKVESHQKKK
eukprot:995041_1